MWRTVGILLLLTCQPGCAITRPAWDGSGVRRATDEVESADDQFPSTHHGFWRKLIPWDHKVDDRPYEERLEDFNNKFRNNG